MKAAQIRKISTNDPYLTNLQAYRGYANADVAYNNYLTGLTDSINAKIKKDRTHFYNFDQFVDYLEKYIFTIGKTFPFTKTGFIKSRFNDYNTSGLTIEISDLSYDDDEQKIDEFVNSPNFEDYLNACNSFGFMVDMASPWKITLDVGSQDVIDGLMNKYGYTNLESLLDIGYKKTHLYYYSEFKRQFLTMYNTVTTNSFTDIEYCNGKARTTVVTPQRYSTEQYYEFYNEQYF